MRRSIWLSLIDQEWQRPILWLSGVRRAGKTFLCKSIHGMEYFDCELPRMRRLMEDPEGFLDSVKGRRIVLDEIQAQLQTRRIHYWRDKRGHEVDFVLKGRGKNPVAIECKWSTPSFDPSGMQAFRRQYEKGDNYVVVNDAPRPARRTFGNIDVTLTNISDLIKAIRASNDSIL